MMAHLAKSQLLLATTNPGKIDEFKSLLRELQGWQLRIPSEMKLKLDVAETGHTYAENAQIKASHYAQSAGMAAMADDSGLELEALNGAPGLFSARFAAKSNATAEDNRSFLLSKLEDFVQPWKASFVSTICRALPSGEEFYARLEKFIKDRAEQDA